MMVFCVERDACDCDGMGWNQAVWGVVGGMLK